MSRDLTKVAANDKGSIGVTILGSTGSIGVSTLDVLSRHRDRFHVFALTARDSVQKLEQQCIEHAPRYAALVDERAAQQLQASLRKAGLTTEVVVGSSAVADLAAHSGTAYVMAAIVGAAGLAPALAAACAGKRILLANKEALVMSGSLFLDAVKLGGAQLIPIDSEHNAIFQCLPNAGSVGAEHLVRGVKRILLTASGGPFLRVPAASLTQVTPEQACAHPRWSMGRKISVDSATLMNKGLELIEACLLFGVPPALVEVVVHPQSIVHSMVEYLDGSVLAQLGNPDMRTPIAHALGCPDRIASGVESLDIVRVGRLDFEAPDSVRFPALGLARTAAEAGGSAPAALNAANEVAVAAFLSGGLAFTDITSVIDRVMQSHRVVPINGLGDVLATDAWARRTASEMTGAARIQPVLNA